MAKKPRVFVLTSRVYEVAGGRTKATITRMLFLQKHFEATLIEMSATKYPGEELPKVFEKYQATFNAINPWTKSLNDEKIEKNYLNFLKEHTGNLGDPKIFAGAQQSFVLPTLSGGTVKSYVADGKIARLRLYHPDGKVDFCALDEDQNIFLRELYDKDALLARYYLNGAGQVISGFIVGKNDTKKFIYRTVTNQLVYSDTIEDHNIAFLNDTLQDGDVVISDVRYYDELLEKLKPKVKKIHVWHEIAYNLRKDSGVNPAYVNIARPDYPLSPSEKIVVFTDDARKEYETEFPHLKDSFTVIPYGTNVKPEYADVTRDKNLLIYIGRLTADKNLAAQIHAFNILHKKYPSTKLHIFGEGNDDATISRLISELNLSDSVKLCGYTHSADKDFQKASMTLFTSNFETFGLTILESLTNGTPVASYDVRFGAKMMIKNLHNGMIAQENTPEALAKAMIKLYKSNISPQQVKESVKDTFSQQRFEDAWLAVISDNKEGEL